MKSNRIIAGVSALLMGTATPAFFIDTNTVTCEKVYDVRLSAETVEIDINDIPENREVEVGINIDNNPGFIALRFLIQKDSSLSFDELFLLETDFNKFGVTCGFYNSNNLIEFVMDSKIDDHSPYFENGDLLKLKLVLPEDVKPGDFFEVKPVLDSTNDSSISQACFARENSMDSYFGKENFADPVSGGIRITGSLPEPSPSSSPSPSPSPLPSPKPSPSPSPSPKEHSGNNNSNGNNGNNGSSNNENGNSSSDNKTTESQTTTTVTSAVSETISVSESETLPVSTVSEVVTSVTTETEAPATSVEETTVTTAATSAAIVVDKEERSKTYLAAVAAAAVILVAAAVLIAKKNSTKK